MQTIITFGIMAIIIGLIILIKVKRGGRPIKGNGFSILAPMLFLSIVFTLSISQLMHIPGKPFHLPAVWEMLIAGILGILFGVIMLTQTSYEIREDGLVYSKRNKNFKYVIIALIAIRIALSQYFKTLDYIEFTVLTMELAFIYIAVWRIGSFVKFRKVCAGDLKVETI